MNDDFNNLMSGEEPVLQGAGRWLPVTVVIFVVGGFLALAWYAYHAGTQSVKDEDLLVVEADKTPVKEKPVDPGGMKFPNQDKTIFDTFAAGDAQQPPKVERVVPAPEEPVRAGLDTSATTWVNEKLHDSSAKSAQLEQVIATDEKKQEPAPPAEVKDDGQTGSYVSPEAAKPSAAAPKPTPVAAQKESPKAEKADKAPAKAEKPVAAAKATGSAQAQLGAYRSEGEAKTAWGKISQAHYALFTGKDSAIVKADLGAKGVYYRLRATGFSDADEVKTFCSQLSASGQACIVAFAK